MSKWTPISGKWVGSRKEFDCPMPKEGQEVLVSYKVYSADGKARSGVLKTTCMYSEKYGYRFYDVAVDSVYAWMPCPKPYKEADCYEKQT